MAVHLGRAGVDVAGEVCNLDEVIELVGDERHKRMTQLVRRPVPTQAGSLAELAKIPADVLEQEWRSVTRAEDESVEVIEAEKLHLLAMADQRGDKQRVEADPSSRPGGLRMSLTDVSLSNLVGALGDLDRRVVAVDVDERPPEPSELSRTEPAHQPGKPHRGVRVLRDGLERDAADLIDSQCLRCLGGRASG